jgi:hypothetical protein
LFKPGTPLYIFFTMAQQSPLPRWAKASALSRIPDHTQTHHSRQDSSGRVIMSSQRPLPDNTQHSQETDIHAPGGIRTCNPSKRAAADPLLRPRGHWDQLTPVYICIEISVVCWSYKKTSVFTHLIGQMERGVINSKVQSKVWSVY